MNKSNNKIGNVQSGNNSPITINQINNQQNNLTLEELFNEAVEIIKCYKIEERKKRSHIKSNFLIVCGILISILSVSVILYFIYPEEPLIYTFGFTVTVGGFILDIVGSIKALITPNDIQRQYCERLDSIYNIFRFNQRDDLSNELKKILKSK
ncbi:hypothetical protein [Gallibacterium anatis]|uniref:hypothetical protein n=1 Tax=Gallibacterium anatis TaxID=750 RepID=UPI00254FD847|nr:hypothetical protein [Gallibacterium anatis]WIM84541.1 hypothetical protein QP020_00335 [Gallibacterium anatis]WKS97834.1 hypothetical protein NYR19_03240 [Gallibacterium anatis]